MTMTAFAQGFESLIASMLKAKEHHHLSFGKVFILLDEIHPMSTSH